jgi:hypothetical protein
MRSERPRYRTPVTSLLCLLAAALSASAFAAETARFELSSDPEQLILSFSEQIGEVESDDHPWLRIYADGSVVAHRPVYYTDPGDFSAQLGEAELRELVQSLIDGGLMDFDSAAVRYEMNAARGQSSSPFYSSDPSTFEIQLNLQAFTAEDGSPTEQDVQRHISWQGLRADVKRYPGVAALGELQATCGRLEELSAWARQQDAEGSEQ